jgi:hypothetical protein
MLSIWRAVEKAPRRAETIRPGVPSPMHVDKVAAFLAMAPATMMSPVGAVASPIAVVITAMPVVMLAAALAAGIGMTLVTPIACLGQGRSEEGDQSRGRQGSFHDRLLSLDRDARFRCSLFMFPGNMKALRVFVLTRFQRRTSIHFGWKRSIRRGS